MDFLAIDVETANSDRASICQVGIAKYCNSQIVDEWKTLVDPEDDFSSFNTDRIHKITKDNVVGAPKFPEIVPIISKHMSNVVCVSHSSFDRTAITRALEKYSCESMPVRWLDSIKVARRTWPECAKKEYNLSAVCKLIGYPLTDTDHHDALEDAKAAGAIIVSAIEKTGLDIEAWLERVEQPINPKNSSPSRAIKRAGNPEGKLYGKVVVFTGALEMPRREAADLASNIGCEVSKNTTKKTSLLVVGDQDLSKLRGQAKSSNHRKAEELITKGQEIQIMTESDFKKLVAQSNDSA